MPFFWIERHEHNRIVAPYGRLRPEPFRQFSEIGDRLFRRNDAALKGAWMSSDRILNVERGAISNLREEICGRRQVTRLKHKGVSIALCQRNRVGFPVPWIDGLAVSNGKPVHEKGLVERGYIQCDSWLRWSFRRFYRKESCYTAEIANDQKLAVPSSRSYIAES